MLEFLWSKTLLAPSVSRCRNQPIGRPYLVWMHLHIRSDVVDRIFASFIQLKMYSSWNSFHFLVESDYDENQHEHESNEHYKKRQEANQAALDSANQVDSENGKAWHQRAAFTCFQCSTNITSVDAAIQHMAEAHPQDKSYSCLLCPKKGLPSSGAILIHLWRHFLKAMAKASEKGWVDWQCKNCNETLRVSYCPRLSWDFLRISEVVQDCLRLSEIVRDCSRLSEIVRDCPRLSENAWKYLKMSKSF